jgi:hypothetical protein
LEDGKTRYYRNGQYITGWQEIEKGRIQFFNSDGSLKSGWHFENNKTYYLNLNDFFGVKVISKKISIDGKEYSFDKEGVLIKETTLISNSIEIKHGTNFDITKFNFKVVDTNGQDISSKIQYESVGTKFDPNKIGKYTINTFVIDSTGKKVSKQISVNVVYNDVQNLK